MIAVVVQLPMTNGVPDLNLPASVSITRDGRHVSVNWKDDRVMSLVFLGTPAGQDPVFCGLASPRAALALAGLGAAVARLRDVWLTPARRTWLMANGIAEVAGVPVIPHVIAGDPGGRDADLTPP